MKRLREEAPSEDRFVNESARLLRLAKAPDPAPAVEQRIRANVLGAALRTTAVAWPRYAVALAAVLVMTGLAGAWVVRNRSGRRPEPPSVTIPQRPRNATSFIAPRSVVPMIKPSIPSAKRVAAHDRMSTREAAEVIPGLGTTSPDEDEKPEPGASVAPTPVPSAPRVEAPEAALMLEATRAFHYDHQPRKAIELIELYLKTYPRGVLVEEAVALGIEARVNLGDPAATTLARDYLGRFPRGRFEELARRALNRAAP